MTLVKILWIIINPTYVGMNRELALINNKQDH